MGFHSNLDNLFDTIKDNEECDLNLIKILIHDLYDTSWNKKGINLRKQIGENIDFFIEENKCKEK